MFVVICMACMKIDSNINIGVQSDEIVLVQIRMHAVFVSVLFSIKQSFLYLCCPLPKRTVE